MATSYVRKRQTPSVIGTERRPASAVPTCPPSFEAPLRTIWRELWRTPVAATWTLSDHRLVMVLCRLHWALEVGIGKAEQVGGQIANISTQLGLTPKSRIILSIEERATPTADAEEGRGRFKLNEVA